MSKFEGGKKCSRCGHSYHRDLGIIEVGLQLCAACAKSLGYGGLFVSTKKGVQ